MQTIKSIKFFLITAFILVFALTIAANFFFDSSKNSYQGNNQNTPKSLITTPTTKPVTTPPVKTIPAYTLAEVQKHPNSSSCWAIVQNNVYDLTSWINQHPGGSATIRSMCGKDATTAFLDQHSGQRRPENELQSFFIGTYKS